MDPQRRSEKESARLLGAQSYRKRNGTMNWTKLLLLAPLIISCTNCNRVPIKAEGSNPTPTSVQLGPAVTVAQPTSSPTSTEPAITEAHPLTAVGENSDARYSPSGDKIIFVSRARPNHRQAQVYELQFDRMIEKRLTFHDGDDAGPAYTPDGSQFIFASTTDEIKEGRSGIDRLMRRFAPEALAKHDTDAKKGSTAEVQLEDGYEIYLQPLHGRVIERLSQSPGFDGDADIEAHRKRIVFSSSRGGKGVGLFILSGKSATALTERSSAGTVVDRSARFSKDGQNLVWVRQQINESKPDSKTESKLMIASGNFRKPKVLLGESGDYAQLAWNPDGTEIVFSAKFSGNFFNLFSVDKDGTCVRRLTNAEADHLQPVLSPDGKHLAFTIARNSHQQIFQMDYKKPADCWRKITATPN
jgi:Tol biopolymer transport system component